MTTIELLTFAGVFIVNILIGYSLGERKNKQKTIVQEMKENIDNLRPVDVGGVEKLEPEDEAKIGTRLEETEKAMEETLDKIIK